MEMCGQCCFAAALPPGKRPDAHCTGVWTSPRSGLDGGEENIAPTGIRFPDLSGISESLTDYAIPGLYWRFETYFIDFEGRCYISVHLPSSSCHYASQNVHFQHRATLMPSVNKRLVSVFLVTSYYLRYRWQSC